MRRDETETIGPFDQHHKAAPYDGGCAECDDGRKTWIPGEIWEFFTRF